MSAKNIPVDYVEDLCARIGRGETPRKINELSPKEFIRQMLPHVKIFLAQGYTYKEIAEFLGHISSGDLKKTLAKVDPAPATGKNLKKALAKADPATATGKKLKDGQAEKTVPARIPCKKCKGSKAPQPGA